jgi:uncharacterized protein YcbK (DUF882 family)
VEEIRTRRSLLKCAGALAAFSLTPLPALARIADTRELSFFHTHTSEKLRVVYAEHGAYVPGALADVNRLLRDFRSGDVHPIDPRLLDILYAVRERTGGSGTFEVISGFRSPHTNEMLRQQSGGVAQRSLHLQGQAIDVRLTGTQTRQLRQAAVAMALGGVGYYPASDFVHLDTGRVRTW